MDETLELLGRIETAVLLIAQRLDALEHQVQQLRGELQTEREGSSETREDLLQRVSHLEGRADNSATRGAASGAVAAGAVSIVAAVAQALGLGQ